MTRTLTEPTDRLDSGLRHGLSAREWSLVRHHFRRLHRVGRPARDPRQVLGGVLWILRTGAPWRDLPRSCGPWTTVYGRFREWARSGLLERLLRRLVRSHALDRSLWCLDSTVIRASRAAAMSGQETGRSRGGFGTKLSIVCDRRGAPLAVALGPGQQHDLVRARDLVQAGERTARGRPSRLAGDKAYSAPSFRAWLRQREIQPVIPNRVDQVADPAFCRQLYACRNVVERLVGWLKESRRVATRYDKLASHYLAFVRLAMISRILRAEFPNRP